MIATGWLMPKRLPYPSTLKIHFFKSRPGLGELPVHETTPTLGIKFGDPDLVTDVFLTKEINKLFREA